MKEENSESLWSGVKSSLAEKGKTSLPPADVFYVKSKSS